MAIIRIMEESEATGRVKQIFEEIKETLQIPFVPALFRALGGRAEQLEMVWRQMKMLYGSGCLDIRTKMLAALAVAAVQRNPYFVKIQGIILRRLGSSDEEIAELLETASFASALNTLVNGLGLEPEL